MKFSKTGTEKSDNLIEVTTWAGLTLFDDILTTLIKHGMIQAVYHVYVIFVNCQLLNGIL
jgi:hypothetical protein